VTRLILVALCAYLAGVAVGSWAERVSREYAERESGADGSREAFR